MKLSVQNKAVALLGVVIVLVFVLGLFALTGLHNATSAVNQLAANATAAASMTPARIHALTSAAHSRLSLSVVIVALLVFAIASAVVAAGVLLEHRMSRATENIGSAARAISTGAIAEPLNVVNGAEYGQASDEVRSMVAYLRDTVAVAQRLADGDLTVDVKPSSDSDALGTALTTVAVTLRKLTKENERLLAKDRDRATTDSLTGLPNRVALMRDLENSLEHVDECPELTLVLFDLDGFKPYNDAFSHAAGDALLVRLAERLRRALDGSSTCYRMGGDEFCVLATAGEKAGQATRAACREGVERQGRGVQRQLLVRRRVRAARGAQRL